MAKIDITGHKYNNLTVLNLDHTKNYRNYWLCRCDCGNTTIVTTAKLRNNHTKSCGCLKGESHNHSSYAKNRGSKEYKTWANMIQRCSNPNVKQYADYGGRGITVCKEWRNSFTKFLKDMGECPYKNYSIERIDNNKGYYPENCKWASRTEQARNKRIQKSNTSGVQGVNYRKKDSKWIARITVNYKRLWLGNYNTFEEAVKARKDAEAKYYRLT